ncbi:malonic semialdehyde reductase [Pararhodospirillum oryzae]|uniref:Putative NADH dehydrogenase/NAD(P)H nitroreductase ROR02_13320 n=1 Tax=Pararhodospirillum oryzae TaxID=478448 RepID=A0A512H6Z8_9PROT|nr:malonic semialdehyde reductase [Pararhodospirillum oryzae]GEO81201.1 putative NADH dehydrogenase/NAD(P)H nitroreductase [Pararhodospirillum oryzae]
MSHVLDQTALDQLFGEARTHMRWRPDPVPVDVLHRLHELLRWAPTSMNCQPARFVFVTTDAARERLRPCLSPGNVEKTMSAPVTAIIATDRRFHERMPQLWTASDAFGMFEGNEALREATAQRNGTLQGAYLILAARALGLDCGPMSGFDTQAVDAAFLADTPSWTTNFLCNLGYGDPAGLFPRGPRPAFDDVCRVV